MKEIKKAQILLYGSIAVVSGTVIYLIVNKYQNEKFLQKLDYYLSNHIGEMGGLDDYKVYFEGDKFLAKLPLGTNYIVLKDEYITQYRKAINNALGNRLMGDDEKGIYGIFRNFKDGVAIAQVSKSYYNAYKINLIDDLKDHLDDDELAQVLDIIAIIPRYRVSK
jgi:hypothetical protein